MITKYKPILFKGEMVRAILEGRKTQTRRLVKPGIPREELRNKAPWKVGDILYVRETWQTLDWFDDVPPSKLPDFAPVHFLVDGYELTGKPRPSMFLPKNRSRIFLEVVNVRVEWLMDISENDAVAEGIDSHKGVPGDYPHDTMYKDYLSTSWVHSPIRSYLTLWDKINGAGKHKENPWVWVVEFNKLDIENPWK